jgi:hypothetical protein
VRSASKYFGFGIDDWHPVNLPVPNNPIIDINTKGQPTEKILESAIISTYDIMQDDQKLRNGPEYFESIRNKYPVRREFSAYRVVLSPQHVAVESNLRELGFEL